MLAAAVATMAGLSVPAASAGTVAAQPHAAYKLLTTQSGLCVDVQGGA